MAPEAPDREPLTLEDFLYRPEWHQWAACLGAGPDAYVRGPKADYGATRELSAGGPVRQECLEVALADMDLRGVWGGATEELCRARVA
jgi:Transcription factor WhiB